MRQLHSAVVQSIASSHISGAGQLFPKPKILLCAAITKISFYVARKPEIFTLCGEAVESLDRIAEKIVMNQCFAFQFICHPTDNLVGPYRPDTANVVRIMRLLAPSLSNG